VGNFGERHHQVVRSIAEHEAELQEKAVHGTVHDYGHGALLKVAPEQYAEQLDSVEAPAFALARRWCGMEAVERFDQAQALRQGVTRLRDLLRRAIWRWRRLAGQASPGGFTLSSAWPQPIPSLHESHLDSKAVTVMSPGASRHAVVVPRRGVQAGRLDAFGRRRSVV
jgi:hypothetical protein